MASCAAVGNRRSCGVQSAPGPDYQIGRSLPSCPTNVFLTLSLRREAAFHAFASQQVANRDTVHFATQIPERRLDPCQYGIDNP
jgi:hypothetical protein